MHHLKYQWILKPFESLTPTELYAELRLRSEVFVVEQNCVFLDMDDKDQFSFHLLGYDGEILIASARLFAPGKVYPEMSIGRVVSSPNYRRKGAGRELMKVAIKKCYELFGDLPIKIGAQLYLKNFYESLGFLQCGEVYDEDGIEHIQMMRTL